MTNKFNVICSQAKWFKSNDADRKTKHSNNSDKMCHYYSKQELNTISKKSTKMPSRSIIATITMKRRQTPSTSLISYWLAAVM
eukprot:940854-Ditylum_brightwellii.AAC.1